MTPSVFHFSVRENAPGLYLGECSTVEGLRLFDQSSLIEITNLVSQLDGGAVLREKDLPQLKTVGDVICHLETHEYALIDFDAKIQNFGALETHDDGECSFKVPSAEIAMKLLRLAVHSAGDDSESLYDVVISNSGKYVSYGPSGKIQIFPDFDSYIVSGI